MIKKLQLGKALNTLGWMSELELRFLAEQADKAKVIMEIGSFYGRSARGMADNSAAKIYCIDPWNADNYNSDGFIFNTDNNTYSLFHANLYGYIKNGRIIPCRFTWTDYKPVEKADFIFIDGDHRYETVVHDIRKAKEWINPGGVIAGHDFHENWPDVVKAVTEEIGKFNLIDTIWSANV